MAKIHTHYDNLKVARLAPQEVIRAAYKALSQKYHPDKNPGDEKAARIMAILNSAYGTLSDPQRRKEHDEWIAAEEWEIEWLESTHGEDRERVRGEGGGWHPEPVDAPAPYRAARDPRWWIALGAVFVLGCAAGALISAQPKVLPAALASALAVKEEAKPGARGAPKVEASDPMVDGWAVGKSYSPDAAWQKAPEVKALSITQLVIPAKAPPCDSDLQTLVAPNGEPWPAQSGYVGGYPLANKGEDMAITVDNSHNGFGVFVKLFDLDRRANVRHLFVLAHDKLTIDQLLAGKYEVRYQNVDMAQARVDCAARKNAAGGAVLADPAEPTAPAAAQAAPAPGAGSAVRGGGS